MENQKTIWENMENVWENHGKSRRIWENMGNVWKVWENDGASQSHPAHLETNHNDHPPPVIETPCYKLETEKKKKKLDIRVEDEPVWYPIETHR